MAAREQHGTGDEDSHSRDEKKDRDEKARSEYADTPTAWKLAVHRMIYIILSVGRSIYRTK